MRKNFSIDYSNLEHSVDKKTYPLKDVQNKVVKVAFDVVKFLDGDTEKLWQIQSGDDGDYIVALYSSDEENQIKTASLNIQAEKEMWEVEVLEPKKTVHFFQNGELVATKSFSALGFKEVDDVPAFKKALLKLLKNNEKFVNEIKSHKKHLKKYPELNNGLK